MLPPDKARLNRKKFADEVVTEFNSTMISIGDYQYLLQALACMVGTKMHRVTPEEVGVLKVLKIATQIKKFQAAKAAEGKTTYTVGELHDTVVGPILRL